MRAAPAEIKRDLETAGTEVRVMTAHGAKGLEARLVVLADFGAERHGSLAPCIYSPVEEPGRREDEAELLLWSPRKKDDPAALRGARDEEKIREAGEHRRLLYVALTRAEDRLVVAAHTGQRAKRDGSWFALVEDALAGADGNPPFAEAREVEGFGTVLVYGRTAAAAAADEATPEPQIAAPDWLNAKLAPEAPGPEPLAPSRAVEHAFVTGGETVVSAISAKERGVLLHRLLEELPGRPDGERKAAAWRYLARMAPGVPEPERAALAEEAVGLVGDLLLAPYLATPSRPEVPVAGRIERPGRAPVFVSGLIDRLIVEKDRVTVLDFKSDRPVPAEPPEGYVAQLSLYRALLKQIFPGKSVECALLWTAERRLDRIPPERLDRALQRALGGPAFP
jgi:ATP-dependent helicase/nuclease subunit A